VALTRSLVVDPAVLLLDEPTAALDPTTSEALMTLMGKWLAEGQRALVMVSHDKGIMIPTTGLEIAPEAHSPHT
jgi:ABC-type lipoprotein export system ATPase subunit